MEKDSKVLEGFTMDEKDVQAKKRIKTKDDGSAGIPEDPLKNWTVDTDPAVMSDDRWVDEHNDLGHTFVENKEMEEGILPGARFMHPMHDVSYRKD